MSNTKRKMTKAEKILRQQMEQRDILLACGGHIIASNGTITSPNLQPMLVLYAVCDRNIDISMMIDAYNPELMVNIIKKRWLINIYVDEKGILQTEDLATNPRYWREEAWQRRREELKEAFGAYLDPEEVDKDIGSGEVLPKEE